jgi:hypothetical protein
MRTALKALVLAAVAAVALGVGGTSAFAQYGCYPYSGGRSWHDTSHWDYHPGHFWRHGNHYHYQPGHWDLHNTVHWH